MAEQQFTQEDLLSNQQSQTLDQLPVEPPVTEPVIPMAEFGKQPTESEKTFKQLIAEPEQVTGKLNDKLGLSDPLIIAQKDNDFNALYQQYDDSMNQKNDELRQMVEKKQITEQEYTDRYNLHNEQMRNYLETSSVNIDNYYENLQKNQPEEETRANRLAASLSKIGTNEAANLINEINSLQNVLYGAMGESRINFQEPRPEDQEPAVQTVSYRQPKELVGTQEGIEIIPDTSAPKMEVNGKIITEDEYKKKAKLTRDAGILTIPAFRNAIKEGTLPPDAILETGIHFPYKTVENLENGKIVTSYQTAYEGVGGEPTYVMMDYDPVAKVYKQRFVEVSKAGAEKGGEPQKLAEIVIDPFMDRVRKKDPEALSKIYNSTSEVLASPDFSDNIKMIALVSAYPKPEEFKQKSEEAFGKRAIEQIAGAMGVSTPSQLFTGGQEILGELQRKIMGRPEADLTPGKFAIDLLKNKPLATEIDRLLKDTQYQRLMKTPEGMSQLVAIAKTNVSNRENLEYINTYGPQLTEITNTIKRTLEYLDNGTKIINSEANKYRIEIETIKSNSGYNAKMKEADALLQRIEANTDPNYRNVYRALIIINKKNKGEEVSADDLDFMSKVGDKILNDREDLQQVVVDDYNKYKDARVEAINSFPEREIAEYIAKNGSAIQMKADELEQFRRSVADSNIVVNYGKLISRLSQAYDNIDSRTYENISSYFPYLETDPQKVDVSALIPFGSPFSALLGGFKSLLGGAAKTYNYIEGRIGYDEVVGSMESTLRDNKQFLETYREKTGNFISDVGYQTFEMLPMLYGFSRMANLGATRPFLYSIVIGDGIKKAAEAGLNTTAERVIYSTVLAEAEVLIEKLVPESVYARRAAKPSLTSDLFKRILTPSTRKAGIREYAKIALKGFKTQGVIGLGEYAEEALAEKLTFVVDRLSNDYLNASFTPTESTGRENVELMLSMLASTAIMGGTRKLAEMARPTVVDNVNIGKTAKSLRKKNYLDQAGKVAKLDKNESLLLAAISTPTGLYEMTKFVADVEAGNISKYDLDTDMYATLKDKLIPAALGTSIFKDKSLSIEQRAAYIAAHGRRIEIEKAINTGEITPDTAKFQLEQIEEDKQKILKDNEFAKQQFNLTGEDIKNKLYEYFEVSDEVIKTREARKAAEPTAAETAATAEGEPIVTPFRPKAAPAVTVEDIERRRQEELDSIGQKAVQRRLQDLREATSEKEIAQAVINIEKNVKAGAKITKEEQDFVNQKRQELKDKGFEIVDHTGKIWNVGMNLDLLNIKTLEEGTNLTQEEIDVIEKELENRNKKREKLKEKGLSEQEIDNRLEDTISIITTVQPQLNKDGKMVQIAKVNALQIEVSQAEEILERSKKNPKNTQQAREDKINTKYDAELASLQTIKTQEDATQISERAQQEGGQPSNLVQREGTQEGQPQVGQAEGAVGQTTQPAADTRNRNLGSQEEQIAATAKALTRGYSKDEMVLRNKAEDLIPIDIKQKQISPSEKLSEAYVKARADGSNPELVKAVEDLIGQPTAPTVETTPAVEVAPTVTAAAEPAPFTKLSKVNTKIPKNLKEVLDLLDKADNLISKELNSGRLNEATGVITLLTIKAIIKAAKPLVKAGMTLEKAIKQVVAKYKVSDKDAINALNKIANIEGIGGDIVIMSARDYMRDSISSQIRGIGKVKNRAKAIQDAVGKVIDDIKDKFGVDFKLSSSAVKRLNKNLSDAVFSKMDDTTAIEQIVADVTPLVEYEVKIALLEKTSKLIDKVKKLDDKARYTGQAGVLAQRLTELNAGALLNSKATLEDISTLNDYLADITGRKINTTNLKDAVDIANKFAPSTKQKAVAGKNAVVDKMQRMIDKIGEGSFDFTDYADLVTAEKAINDFEEQIGDLSDLTDEEFKDVNAKFEELKKALPKPIEQLMEDAKNQIDAELTNQINRLKQAIETSQEFRDSIPNPFFYDELLFLKDALSEELARLRDNNQGFIASLTPKERMLMSSAIDESFRGNVNSTAYQFSTMVRAFRVFEGAYKFGATMAEKKGLIDADGITNFAKSRIDNFRRIFVDIDYNVSSAKLIASGMSVFKIHMLDISMNTGSDEFGVGTLEKTIYGPIVNANDKAFNMFSEGLTKLEESKKFLNSKGNQAVIKRGIRRLDQTLGTGLFGNATVFKYIKNRLGWDNTLYFDISNRMVSIVKSQIDYISNLKEGQPLIDRALTRNILKIKPEEFATRKIKNLQELYKGKPMAITEMTDSREMFDIIAYGILTDGGTKTLEELSVEELTKLLSKDQQKAMMKWTEHIEDTRNLSEAAMVRRGRKPAFLNNYMPIQVVSDKEGVKDIDDYMKSAGNNVGVDSGQLKARSSETGRMNLDGLSVLYNNLKDLYLVHEVKAPLDALKGIDRAIAQLNGEGNLFAATYAQAVQIDTGNRVKEALDANEKIVNDSLKTAYKVVGAVGSFSARAILIGNYRQVIKDYPANVIKLAATLFFANKRFKNQVSQLANPFSKITYKTPKGEYVWEDYVEIAKITGSPAYRTVTMRGDNFLYEFSKSKEQLQREQRLTSWQDMRPRKLAWMSKFEEAFFRLTGEYLDHKAFADPRGAYRAIYNTAVQRASDAADALLDREQGLPSIIRQPLKMQMVPILGRFMRNASGGKWTGLIRKNSIGGLVFSFMAGFPTTINNLFFRHIRTTLSTDKSITLKERAKNATEALVKVVLPQLAYNYAGAIQGILQATIDSAVGAIGGGPEEKKQQYAKFNSLKGWELQVAKVKAMYNEAEEKAINSVINSLFASSVDVGAMNVFRPLAGFIAFKGWQQGAVEALMQKGLTRQQVEERKQSIREIENLLFEGFNIKLIHAFPTEEYTGAIRSKYGWKEVDALKDIIRVTGAFGVVLGEADKLFDLTKLMASTDEYEGLSDREIYVAATLKAYSLFFSNIILGGKYGWVFSSFAGDARGVANMLISDEITKLRAAKKAAKKGGGGIKPPPGGMMPMGMTPKAMGSQSLLP